mmetsp:Transcript_725/g.1732  ORF Transcript_725/g.1732 Transcript_725/m.1732 type:complete len:340 (-) Transcript_725:158-1177(-)|eukprot:CAMPEP_0170598236 /NCGR_PEP_ID=MMETSP0224-20130122/16137_1 /TAXON_ID=285029 /ORGANISM="Togula jolla, Strain CCCM 725" /LENGTH=339 /DNA_ID=CAMNT_0010922769 /DNA_START=24 /DNA_END=1043 /DNA_ORIENTATION=+
MAELDQIEQKRFGLAKTMMLATAYILVSAGLINFNKYLMTKGRFPHAVALTTCHMLSSWVCLLVLYYVKPDFFPSMEKRKSGPVCLGVVCDFGKYFLPLGAFFASGLFLGNLAYLYSSVPFLQFMKEANVVLVFGLSAIVGMQTFTRARVVALIWILAGATMSVSGEIQFVLMGFLLQAVSQLGECCKNVLGEWMMTRSSFRLDPLTYTLSMAPVALVPLAIGTLMTADSAVFADFLQHWHLILANALMAVVLNVMISIFIRGCSAMAFILTGLCKDIFIVIVSAVAFGDQISLQQIVGFMICLTGIAAWSSIKLKPDLWTFLDSAEKKPLVPPAPREP